MSGINGQFLFGAPVPVSGWDFTESSANDDTYCVEMENSTSGGNETGAGLGLSGTDLVATANGTVGGVSSVYRTLTNGAFNFTESILSASAPPVAPDTVVVVTDVTLSILVGELNEFAPFAKLLFVTTYCSMTMLPSDNALLTVPSPK